jgi:hypothetical protein
MLYYTSGFLLGDAISQTHWWVAGVIHGLDSLFRMTPHDITPGAARAMPFVVRFDSICS